MFAYTRVAMFAFFVSIIIHLASQCPKIFRKCITLIIYRPEGCVVLSSKLWSHFATFCMALLQMTQVLLLKLFCLVYVMVYKLCTKSLDLTTDKVRESNGCCLVHCLAGISRSPTLAIAYIMKHLNMSSDDAYRYDSSTP